MTKVEQVKNDKNYIAVLDHGFVGLVDHMGDDQSIVQAARVSYGKGTKNKSDDIGLIRYLLRNKHTTPFEMCEIKFHCKMPIFVARQWIRHRTASVNEYSARYSEMPDEFYIPNIENIAPQSKSNNQGRDGQLCDYDKEQIRDAITYNGEESYGSYQILLGNEDDGGMFSRDENDPYPGLARELARMILPLNNYTEWYWKMDLHNLFHFLQLRLDPHAQFEIRVFAEAIYKLTKPLYPIACKAFEDYKLNAVTFSADEMKIINRIIKRDGMIYEELDYTNLSEREATEFLLKTGVTKYD